MSLSRPPSTFGSQSGHISSPQRLTCVRTGRAFCAICSGVSGIWSCCHLWSCEEQASFRAAAVPQNGNWLPSLHVASVSMTSPFVSQWVYHWGLTLRPMHTHAAVALASMHRARSSHAFVYKRAVGLIARQPALHERRRRKGVCVRWRPMYQSRRVSKAEWHATRQSDADSMVARQTLDTSLQRRP